MSNEKWLALGLSSVVLIVLSLIAALTYSYSWSFLAIATLIFFLSYPIIWVAWRCYRLWCDAIMVLTNYTQTLREAQCNFRFKEQHPDNLLLALQEEINTLSQLNQEEERQNQTIDTLLSHVLESWSVPVCLFDQKLKLHYRNNAMTEKVKQPMLVGTDASNIGFEFDENVGFSHKEFDSHWQCQTISYTHKNKKHWLFSALDVSQRLQQNQSLTQQNLIRVLGHELRNSLTPMSSMADTLLSAETLQEEQVRLVLSRIQQRSNRLLTFISEYSQLTQLPKPKCSNFAIKELIDEAQAMVGKSCEIHLHGNNQCYGDMTQVSQVLINIIKNAVEACVNSQCIINIKLYYQQQNQIIEVDDNGPGFANLDNVLTPFYTTKNAGSGIGLSLCAEIASNHNGQLKVSNNSNGGAKILMSWPIKQ